MIDTAMPKITPDYVHWFRNSAPYINTHRGKTFVIMFGGEAVNHPNFREKRTLEMAFEKTFPNEYSSKYSLVTFNEDIGYREAMLRGRAQDKAILNMLADGDISTALDMTEEELKNILKKVKQETEAILEDDRIAGLK